MTDAVCGNFRIHTDQFFPSQIVFNHELEKKKKKKSSKINSEGLKPSLSLTTEFLLVFSL